LIGVAMFEIFHATQYLAIVWVFHRKQIHRASESPGTIGAICRRREVLIVAYLGLIAAFGATRYFSGSITQQSLVEVFAALLVTSNLLHYYFDGFIWKVHEARNQEQLAGTASQSSAGSVVRETPTVSAWPALAHLGKWAIFILPAAALYGAERRSIDPASQATAKFNEARVLAAVAPNQPTVQLRLANAAFDVGDLPVSIEAAHRATKLDPRSAEAQGTLGHAKLRAGDLRDALHAYARATTLDPNNADHRLNLAGALADAGQWKAAEAEYQAAVELTPEGPRRTPANRVVSNRRW
jgi:tetratricopeptide (TPR) repeat protein